MKCRSRFERRNVLRHFRPPKRLDRSELIVRATEDSEILTLGFSAVRMRKDVIEFERMFGRAQRSGFVVHVLAFVVVALEDLSFQLFGDVGSLGRWC